MAESGELALDIRMLFACWYWAGLWLLVLRLISTELIFDAIGRTSFERDLRETCGTLP